MAIPYLATFLLLVDSSFLVIINKAAINIFVRIAFFLLLNYVLGISAQKGDDWVKALTVLQLLLCRARLQLRTFNN